MYHPIYSYRSKYVCMNVLYVAHHLKWSGNYKSNIDVVDASEFREGTD